MIVRRKSFVAVEKFFFISKVSAYTHIRNTCNCIGKKLHGTMKSIKADDLVQNAFLFMVSSISKCNFNSVVKWFLHFLYPEFGSWNAVCIGQ